MAKPLNPPKNDKPAQSLSPGTRIAPKSAFKKGHPKLGGRGPGVANKITKSVKEALAEAFEGMGGIPALIRWGKQNPTDFYRLWARLLPIQITGGEGGPVVVENRHDLKKLSIEELTKLAELVDKATIARAAAGEVVSTGTAIRIREVKARETEDGE